MAVEFHEWVNQKVKLPLQPASKLDGVSIDLTSKVLGQITEDASLLISSVFEPSVLASVSDPRFPIDAMIGSGGDLALHFEGTTSKTPCSVQCFNVPSAQCLFVPQYNPITLGFGDQKARRFHAQWTGFPRHKSLPYLNKASFGFRFDSHHWQLRGEVHAVDDEDLSQLIEVGKTLQPNYVAALACDGDTSRDDLNLMLHRLSNAFAFLCGQYLPPVASTALREDGECLWLQIGGDVRRFRSGPRLADYFEESDLQEFLSKYMQSADQNGDSLTSATFLYSQCVSCEPSVRPAIMLGQSALEELARWTLVERESLQPSFVKKMDAADMFDVFFSVVRLSKRDLAQMCQKTDMRAVLKGISEIRNAIAHGSDRDVAPKDIKAAWNSVIMLLEVSILALIGYRGRYRLHGDAPAGDFARLLAA